MQISMKNTVVKYNSKKKSNSLAAVNKYICLLFQNDSRENKKEMYFSPNIRSR